MSTLPDPQHSIAALIDAAHEAKAEAPRGHLGASLLGHHCDRWLWLNFRWAVIEKFPGRILRVFRRGQNEEAQIVSDLRAIGIDIRDTQGAQSRVDFGAHVGGSLDGIIHSGVQMKKLLLALLFAVGATQAFAQTTTVSTVNTTSDVNTTTNSTSTSTSTSDNTNTNVNTNNNKWYY